MLPKPSLQWEWETGYSRLADFMAGLRCQSQSARAKNLKTGKIHPKGTAPLWVTAAEARPGPEVQVGRCWCRAQLWVEMKQRRGSTSHSHHSPQELKGCVEGSTPRIQQHRGERIWGRGWYKGCFLASRGSWGDF